jgi:hypothetical protein
VGSSPTEFAAERLAAADRLALLELHARYAHAIDDGRAEEWAACFTADGVLRTTRPLRVEGRAALAAFAADWHEIADGTLRHMTWHHRFEVAAGDAVGTCSAALLRTARGRVAIDFTAVYRDRFARTQQGWLIRERFVAIDRG